MKHVSYAPFVLLCAALLTLGCGENTRRSGADAGPPPPRDGGARPDASTPADAGGPRDAGMMTSDPCSADMASAISTVGCNGGLGSSSPAAGQIGGACTPDGGDPPGPGTCAAGPAGSTALCVPSDTDPMMGRCYYSCTPGGNYVSTGGCPTGARCFDLGGNGVCFRDCNSAADCVASAGEECDGEGSCVGTAAP